MKTGRSLPLLLTTIWTILSLANGFASDRSESNVVETLTNPATYIPNQMPPNQPVAVKISFKILEVFGMTPTTGDFETLLFLFTTWTDNRLNYTGKHNSSFIDITYKMNQIWTPKLYFPNAKAVARNDLSAPNYRLVLYKNGTVKESQRIMVTTHCEVKLHMFPFDAQKCPIDIESISAVDNHYRVEWGEKSSKSDVQVPEFELVKLIHEKCTPNLENSYCLRLVLDMDRKYHSYVFSIYLPFIFVTSLCYVAFWMDGNEIRGKSTLGILGITTSVIHLGNLRNQSPHVGYLRAVDVYGVTCLIFSLMCFMVSNVSNYALRRQKALAEKKKKEADAAKKKHDDNEEQQLENITDSESKPKNKIGLIDVKGDGCLHKMLDSYDPAIDIAARYIFPVLFIAFNIVYWLVCLVFLEQ